MTPGAPAFEPVVQRLRGRLEPSGRRMHVSGDAEGMYSVERAPAGERNPGTWFGSVRRGKSYVSIYLMPVYADPSLMDGASPELKRRMQGKSCFNFKRVDERLFGELEDILQRGFEQTAAASGS